MHILSKITSRAVGALEDAKSDSPGEQSKNLKDGITERKQNRKAMSHEPINVSDCLKHDNLLDIRRNREGVGTKPGRWAWS